MNNVVPHLFLRLGIGSTLLYNGMEKVFHGATTFPFSQTLHTATGMVISPSLLDLSIGIVQLVFGLLVILGLLTRAVSALTALTVLAATIIALHGMAFSDLFHAGLFISVCLALTMLGAGGVSIDSAIRYHHIEE